MTSGATDGLRFVALISGATDGLRFVVPTSGPTDGLTNGMHCQLYVGRPSHLPQTAQSTVSMCDW